MGEQMKIIYELSWLWETLGIALFAVAFVSANGTKISWSLSTRTVRFF